MSLIRTDYVPEWPKVRMLKVYWPLAKNTTLKKNGITVDGVHYAVRFKGKIHIIINKVFLVP